MALTIGNITTNTTNPSGGDVTFSHTQNTGSDLYLYVHIAMGNSEPAPNGVTYNGVSMTLVDTKGPDSTYGVIHYVWELASPSTGANNIVVDFDDFQQYGNVYTMAISTTGSGGYGNSAWSNSSNTTATANISSIGSGSTVFFMSLCNTSITQTHTVDSTVYTAPFFYSYTRFSVDSVLSYKENVSTGNASVTVTAGNNVAAFAYEITAATGVTTRRRIIIV